MAEQLKIEPLFNSIILRDRPSTLNQSAGGIVIPDAAQELAEAEVIAIGPGRRNEMGHFFEVENVRVGDIVLLTKYSGQEVFVGGENLRVVREHDILAKLVKKT